MYKYCISHYEIQNKKGNRRMHKYLIANIKIPFQVNADGTSVSMINHSIIQIEPCEELPPENGNQLLMIQESIQKYMDDHASPEEEKREKNTTFRNHKRPSRRFTMKRR